MIVHLIAGLVTTIVSIRAMLQQGLDVHDVHVGKYRFGSTEVDTWIILDKVKQTHESAVCGRLEDLEADQPLS